VAHYPNKKSLATAEIHCTISPPLARFDERLFHSPGPAAASAPSPKLLYVRVTTHVRLVVERSRRSRASATNNFPKVVQQHNLGVVEILRGFVGNIHPYSAVKEF